LNDLAPIVLFVYNRPEHTKKTLQALQQNNLASDSELYIYADAAKNDLAQEGVDEVGELISKTVGFKKITVIKQKKNIGLANSIIGGVTDIVNKYGKVIVLEDDLVTSPYFLTFMNDGLNTYERDNRVASIHGYIYPIENLPNQFFIKGADCWGWATWSRAWDKFESDGQKLLDGLRVRELDKEFDFNNSYRFTQMLKDQIKGKNNSWAIRWYASAFLNNMLTLYPGKSYVKNIGNDESGTHCGTSNVYDVELNCNYQRQCIDVKEDLVSKKKMEQYFTSLRPTIIQKITAKIRRLFL